MVKGQIYCRWTFLCKLHLYKNYWLSFWTLSICSTTGARRAAGAGRWTWRRSSTTTRARTGGRSRRTTVGRTKILTLLEHGMLYPEEWFLKKLPSATITATGTRVFLFLLFFHFLFIVSWCGSWRLIASPKMINNSENSFSIKF